MVQIGERRNVVATENEPRRNAPGFSTHRSEGFSQGYSDRCPILPRPEYQRKASFLHTQDDVLHMTRRKGEITARMNERNHPNIVELALPPSGFGRALDIFEAFHQARGIQSRRGSR
jgi:hypothetical protein